MEAVLLTLLGTLILPGALVWTGFFLATLTPRTSHADGFRLLGWVAAAIIPAYLFVQPSAFPPRESADWLPWIALGGVLLSGAWTYLRSLVVRWMILVLIASGTIGCQVAAAFQYQWKGVMAVIWLVSIFFLLLPQFLVWNQLLPSKTQLFRWAWPGAYAGLVAGALLISGSASLGQRAGIIASAAGSLFLWRLIPKQEILSTVWLPLPLLLLSSMILQGVLYAELPLLSGVLLVAAPLLAAATLRFRNDWITGGVLFALSGCALVLAAVSSPLPTE